MFTQFSEVICFFELFSDIIYQHCPNNIGTPFCVRYLFLKNQLDITTPPYDPVVVVPVPWYGCGDPFSAEPGTCGTGTETLLAPNQKLPPGPWSPVQRILGSKNLELGQRI